MSRTIVALLLARGTTGLISGQQNIRYKALLPVHGVPLADYVLRALQGSAVAKIYVAQSPDQCLQDVLTPHSKNVFLDIEGGEDSLSWSIAGALEKLLACYEPAERKELFIMLVPCDIPMVRAADFDELIAQALSQEASLILTMIPHELVRNRFPHKRFQTLYHRDIGQRMVNQSVVFASGRLLDIKPDPSPGEHRIVVLDDRGLPIPHLDRMIDAVHRGRHDILLWPNLIYTLFIRRLIANGRGLDILRLLFDLALGNITAQGIGGYLYAALRVKFGVIVSRIPNISGDIDTFQDLELI
jgi:molybdopterin-guanine dinucleotide biosynthesis protein A